MLAGDGQAILADLKKAAKYEGADPPTNEDFAEMCKRINALGPTSHLRRIQPIERTTWIDFLVWHRMRSARAIDKLFRYTIFLDSEHVRLITKIDNSTLFGYLDELRFHSAGVHVNYTNLTFLAEDLFRDYGLTRQLQQYADRHLKGLA
jgi:hypothetical protein